MLPPDNAIVVVLWVSWIVVSAVGSLTSVDALVGASGDGTGDPAANAVPGTAPTTTSAATKTAETRTPARQLTEPPPPCLWCSRRRVHGVAGRPKTRLGYGNPAWGTSTSTV